MAKPGRLRVASVNSAQGTSLGTTSVVFELLEETKRRREAYDAASAAAHQRLPFIKRLHAATPPVESDSPELRDWRDQAQELSSSRNAYEDAVLGLYASGMSVSDIADALGAPEREIRLVTGARSCSFCGEAKESGASLITGPTLDICDRCVRLASAAARGATPSVGLAAFGLSRGSRACCSFCSRGADQLQAIVEIGRARICDECLDLCAEILERDPRPVPEA